MSRAAVASFGLRAARSQSGRGGGRVAADMDYGFHQGTYCLVFDFDPVDLFPQLVKLNALRRPKVITLRFKFWDGLVTKVHLERKLANALCVQHPFADAVGARVSQSAHSELGQGGVAQALVASGHWMVNWMSVPRHVLRVSDLARLKKQRCRKVPFSFVKRGVSIRPVPSEPACDPWLPAGSETAKETAAQAGKRAKRRKAADYTARDRAEMPAIIRKFNRAHEPKPGAPQRKKSASLAADGLPFAYAPPARERKRKHAKRRRAPQEPSDSEDEGPAAEARNNSVLKHFPHRGEVVAQEGAQRGRLTKKGERAANRKERKRAEPQRSSSDEDDGADDNSDASSSQ